MSFQSHNFYMTFPYKVCNCWPLTSLFSRPGSAVTFTLSITSSTLFYYLPYASALKFFLFKSYESSNFLSFTHIYADQYTHIQWPEARTHIWKRTCGICLSEPGWPHLECFPSNFLTYSQFQLSLYMYTHSHYPFTDGHLGWFYFLGKKSSDKQKCLSNSVVGYGPLGLFPGVG